MKLRPITVLVQSVRDNIWYLLPQLFFLTIAIVLLFIKGNHKLFLSLNSWHFIMLDRPMLWLSEISSGWIILSIFVLICAKKSPKESLVALIVVFIAWYISIAIKYNHFASWRSPSVSFKPAQLHTLGTSLQPELNLPSAHAAIISSLFFIVAVIFRNIKRSSIVVFSLSGIILMYSRIYVGWSYVNDIVAGAVIGILSVLIFFGMIEQRTYNWYNRRTDWEQTLIIASLRTAAICTIFVNLKHAIL